MIGIRRAPLAISSRSTACRGFFGKGSAMPEVSMEEEFPGVPVGTPIVPSTGQAELTKTANGMRVASDGLNDSVVILGIHVDAGSKYETDETSGLTQLMANMAFRSTFDRSDIRLYRDIESIGGTIEKSSGRDYLNFSISVLPEFVEDAAAILAETTLSPKFPLWDVEQQKQKVYDDLEESLSDPTYLLKEGLYAAAFYDTEPLGRPVADIQNISKLNENQLWDMYSNHFNTERMTLVGTGIDHGTLSNLANEMFINAQKPAGALASIPATTYVGGEAREKIICGETYLALGFKGAAWSGESVNASFVLQSLLQMKLKDVKSAAVDNDCFADSGLFSVFGQSSADNSSELLDRLVSEVKNLSNASADEIERAKKITAATFADKMDSRLERVQVFGNMAMNNHISSVHQIVQGINAVKPDDVKQFAQQMFSAGPSLSSLGSIASVPRYNALREKF